MQILIGANNATSLCSINILQNSTKKFVKKIVEKQIIFLSKKFVEKVRRKSLSKKFIEKVNSSKKFVKIIHPNSLKKTKKTPKTYRKKETRNLTKRVTPKGKSPPFC